METNNRNYPLLHLLVGGIPGGEAGYFLGDVIADHLRSPDQRAYISPVFKGIMTLFGGKLGADLGLYMGDMIREKFRPK